MTMVKLFQNRKSGEFVFCPFVPDPVMGPGMNCASGPLLRLNERDFRERGLAIAAEYLAVFHKPAGSAAAKLEKSELYNTMTSTQRNRFLAEHCMMNISVAGKGDTASLSVGDDLEKYGYIPFPFAEETFLDDILRAFASV